MRSHAIASLLKNLKKNCKLTLNFLHFGLRQGIENEVAIPCRFYNTGIDETAL